MLIKLLMYFTNIFYPAFKKEACVFLKFNFFRSIYILERQSYKERWTHRENETEKGRGKRQTERERDEYSIYWFILHMAVTGPGQSQELHLGLPYGWQGPKYLEHIPPAFRGRLAGSWTRSEAAGIWTSTSILDGITGASHTTILTMAAGSCTNTAMLLSSYTSSAE